MAISVQKFKSKRKPKTAMATLIKQIRDSENGKGTAKGLTGDPGSIDIYSNTIAPLYDPDSLAQLLIENTTHATCCKAKASDVAWAGFTVSTEEGAKPEDPQIVGAKTFLNNFFKNVSVEDQLSIQNMAYTVWLDYCSIGWGTFEVVRGDDRRVVGLEHVQARTIRVHKDRNRYVQQRGNKHLYFVPFGSKVIEDFSKMDDTESGLLDTNKCTAWNEAEFVDPESGEFDPTLDWDEAANELVFIPNYHPVNDDYGVPEGVTAIHAIQAQRLESDYNLGYFERDCVPRMVVVREPQVREGGPFVSMPIEDVDDSVESEGADIDNTIQDFFVEELQDRASVLMITAEAGEKWHFKTISPDSMDGSFMEYRKNNRDEILLAHRMTASQIGIVDEPNLGSTSGYSQAEQYKTRVVSPMQRILSTVLNRVLKHGLYISGITVGIDELDISDYDQISAVHVRYITNGVLSINEVREELAGKEPIPGGDMHRIAFSNNPIVTEVVSGVPQMFDESQKDLIASVQMLERNIPFRE